MNESHPALPETPEGVAPATPRAAQADECALASEREPMSWGAFRYSLRNTGHGSGRFGPCEVCGRNCETTYIQSEERYYAQDDDSGWTVDGCHTLFGHRGCLLSWRQSRPALAKAKGESR